MLTPVYKGRMELFLFSHCTDNGIEPQFSLLAGTAFFSYLQRAKQVDKTIVLVPAKSKCVF